MANNVNIDQLANAIARELENYSREVEEKINDATDKISKEAVDELKSTSPKRYGDYGKSWTRKKTANGWVVHNKRYRLTHLLEKGHAKRGGGRVGSQIHIAPVESDSITKLVSEIERAVQE